MRRFRQDIRTLFQARPLRSLAILFLCAAACPAIAQPGDPSREDEKPRIWEVHTTQRYRTMSDLADRDGGMAWHESTVGISGGLFLPGPGMLRVGTEYAYTRFAFADDTRLGLAGSEPFRHVQEVRLSAHLFTPWSSTWRTQLFGAVTSGFESGAAPDNAFSGLAGLGVARRFSDRLSIGLGGFLLGQMGSEGTIVVPILLLDWQITERLALLSRQEITLTYLLNPQGRLSFEAVTSLFGIKQFRLDDAGAIPGGVAGIEGFDVGGRVVWEPFPALTVDGTVGAALEQVLRIESHAGREIADVDLTDALQLSLTVRYRF